MPQSRKAKVSQTRRRASKQPGKILDLFAGAGGWAEGLRMLGLTALGIETDEWACATSVAAGHGVLRADVATLDPQEFSPVWGMVGSPPCQAYSTAGKGLGRQDKPLVIACAHELAAGHDSRAARLKQSADPRSLLTVEPLRYALVLKPRWIAQQVPAVLELWTIFAGLLSVHGYHTAAGILSAERYGVPQTRKRAFLIASLDGPVELPAATHRSYQPRREDTPEEELGLLPWVSMAEALGWGMTTRPAMTVVAGNKHGGSGSVAGMVRRRRAGQWIEIRRSGSRINEGFDTSQAPSQAVTSRVNRWQAHDVEPWTEQRPVCETRRRGAQPRPVEQPAPTMLAAGLAKGTPVWAGRRPATTVACDRRVHPPGHKHNASDSPGRYQQRRGVNAVRVTVEQAAVLQGFPADYPWQGSRTRQFTQVGNAVPPPLAHRVAEQAIAPSASRSRSRTSRRRSLTVEVLTVSRVDREDPDELCDARQHAPVSRRRSTASARCRREARR
jgi:DNA (cytosine-5)-methyltransferase 1